MTADGLAPAAPDGPKHVRLVQLPAQAIHALASGDLARANLSASITLTPYFVATDDAGVWQRRSRQIEDDPACVPWITRAIWDVDSQVTVGRAGFHGPPDSSGMVEIGYAIDPLYRRRGYARAALESLLHRASLESSVATVRVTIRPDNMASRQLAQQYGFVEVGEQWDDDDGLETIYEVRALNALSAAGRQLAASSPPGVTRIR